MDRRGGRESTKLLLRGQPRSGLVQLEAARGALLSAARPLLVMHDPRAVAELRQLEPAVAAGGRKNSVQA